MITCESNIKLIKETSPDDKTRIISTTFHPKPGQQKASISTPTDFQPRFEDIVFANKQKVSLYQHPFSARKKHYYKTPKDDHLSPQTTPVYSKRTRNSVAMKHLTQRYHMVQASPENPNQDLRSQHILASIPTNPNLSEVYKKAGVDSNLKSTKMSTMLSLRDDASKRQQRQSLD